MTTLTILFCALRDLYYKNLNDNVKKNRILGRIKNFETGSERLRFTTQFHEQNVFEQEIINGINYDIPRHRDELKKNNFLNAAFLFREKIEALKASSPESIDKFTDYLLDQVRVITIECTTRSFAIKLFQVLNNRGMDLTPADLIKSYLMGRLKSDEDLRIFEQDWVYIENKAKEFNEGLTNLFTYYLYYLLGSNPKKSLYDELERLFKLREPKNIIYEFKKLIDYFDEIDDEHSKVIYALEYLRHDVFWKSILLTAKMENWSHEDFLQLAKTLRNFYYVYWIAEYTTSKTKQTSFNIIAWIKNKETISSIKSKLDAKLKEDRVVIRAWKNLNFGVYDFSWCKPILAIIEYQQTDNTNINYIDLEKFVHVEHILPQGFAKIRYWQNLFKQEEAEKMLNSIGNLTLLSGKKNIEASNRPFLDKLSVYSGKGIDGMTGFVITQNIVNAVGDDKNWTTRKINDRANWIFKELCKIFEIDFFWEGNASVEEDESISASTQLIYNTLQEKILSLGPDVKLEPKKYYIAFKRRGNFATVEIQNSKIKIWIDYDVEKINDPKGLVRDVSQIGHHGTGDKEIELSKEEDIDYVMNFIKAAYIEDEFSDDDTIDDIKYSEEHAKEMTNNPLMYQLLLEFRKELSKLTQFEEKINKYFIGFKNGANYFAAFRLRDKYCYISVLDVKINPNHDSDSVRYKDRRLRIQIKSIEDIQKYINLVLLSEKYNDDKSNNLRP